MYKVLIYCLISITFMCCVTTHDDKLSVQNKPVLQDKISQLPTPKQRKLFVEEKKIVIKPKVEPNTSGSLFNIDDERNYLFVEQGPMPIGKFLNIKVVSNRDLKKNNSDSSKKDNEVGKKEDATESANEVEEDLLKSLPHLDPEDTNLATLKSFKMKIINHFPNGDVLAAVSRKSENEQDEREVVIQSRIPYNRLVTGEQLTTDDLMDVQMVDNGGTADYTERSSNSWEDEYTMRLSGFTEAKSKSAQKLENKRKQLESVKNRLHNKLTAFNKERELLAKQRTEIESEKVKNEEKIAEINKTISEKEAIIAEQKTTIEEKDKEIVELKPAEEKAEAEKKEEGK